MGKKVADFEKDNKKKQEEIMKRIESEGRADGLEKEVATKDAYIKELEDIIVEKDFSLSEMEEKKGKDEADGVEKLDEKQKTGPINELEKRCKKLEEDKTRVEGELNDEVESQRLSIQNLKRQQDELKSKLAATEAELDEAKQEKDKKKKKKKKKKRPRLDTTA